MPPKDYRTPRPVPRESLEERAAALEVLRAFNHDVMRLVSRYMQEEEYTSEACLREIAEIIRKQLDIYSVAILLLDDISRELVLYVGAGEEAVTSLTRQYRIKLGQGLSGACVRSGETILCNDVERDPRYVRGPLAATKSELVVPIRVGQRVMGALDLQSKTAGIFKKELVDLMEEITTSIGFVLENKQLYDNLKDYSEQLEHKVAEQVRELKASEERYRLLVENTTDPILTLDTEGHVTWLNRAAAALLGRTLEELAGTHIAKVVRKGSIHKLYSLFKDVLDGKKVRPIQIELENKAGETRTAEMTVISLTFEQEGAGLEIILRDITDRVTIDRLKKNYLKSLEDAVGQRTAEIKETQRAAIFAIATLAESIDEDTGGHLDRIRYFSRAVAEEMRKTDKHAAAMSDDYVELLFDLSPLHDLGKVGIRDYILLKQDKLTVEEFDTMKRHTEIGATALRIAGQQIRRESIFSIGEMIAHFHHEKWDGSGYPAVEINGEMRPLRGEEIPLCARVVALADVYDALTSKRPYKEALPHEWAKQKILSESGKHFDPDVVAAFVRCEQEFIRIKQQFPDSMPTVGNLFMLPARDRDGEAAPPSAGAAS